MNPKSAAVPAFVLTACILMCACTAVDKFTIHKLSNDPASLEEQSLVLKERCKYEAGLDISGSLSPGPLQPDAIATPAPSNSHIKETIFLIQVGDVEAQGVDVASFIGVRKDGAFIHNVILHSDAPGTKPFGLENAKIRFTPENCHYSMETVRAQGGTSNPSSPPDDMP